MKILQIFPGKVWGGAEQYVLDLGTALTAEGHEVSYVARPSEVVLSRLHNHIPFTIAPMKGLFDRKSPKIISQLLKDIDVVHVHELKHVGLVKKAARIAKVEPKIVVTRHIARKSHTMPWLIKSIKDVHKIIFVSDLAKDLWIKANKWISPEKCVIIHNSIPEIKESQVDNLRKRYAIDKEIPLLMFTGRIRKSKGCEVIIEALGKLKHRDWKLIFIGNCKPSDYDKTLMNTAEKFDIADRIIFYGFSDNARSLAKQADIGLAPSIVKEACGLSAMEFMISGKPVIGTNNGALPEYISNWETGVLIPQNSPGHMTEALERLLSENETRTNIGKNAEKFFHDNLSYPHFIKKIISTYQ